MPIKTDNDWLRFFNPCGGEIVSGYRFERCFSACIKEKCVGGAGAICLSSDAFQMAGYLLRGNTIDEERRDYQYFLGLQIGRKVVDFEGNIIVLSGENLEILMDLVTQKAGEITQAINTCIGTCVDYPKKEFQEYFKGRSRKQRAVFVRFLTLLEQCDNFSDSGKEAQKLIERMRATLKRAIDLNLDELGLILRGALYYRVDEVLLKRGIYTRIIPSQIDVSLKFIWP